MAATSPYSGNDYAAVSNFRPYELPINDIFKGLVAQDSFWKQGAERVKSVYDNALNLKLSLEPNKEIRRKYMEDADKQLTKLSSADLSDPSVQRQGFSLFKPLFQDEGIIYDDLSTRHYEKVRNDALMYRQKDNGAGYSDINMQYAMQGYNEFVNSKDRMAGKSAYENRKEYTPFYDYTEDFEKALKQCPPSSIQTTSPDYGSDGKTMTGYMRETSMRSLSSGQARGCLEAGLSGKAYRQLQIEGAVAYKNNPDVLASDTNTYLSGVAGNISEQLQELHAKKIALAKNPQGLSTTELAAVNTQLDQQSEQLTTELDKTNHSVRKLAAGDTTDLMNNYETYAGSVYSFKKLYKKAMSSAFQDSKVNYKGDPVQLNAIQFSQQKYLKSLDFNYDVSIEQMKEGHDKEMKLIEMMYGGSGKGSSGGSGGDVYTNPLTGEVTINPNITRVTPNETEIPEPDKHIYEKLTTQVGDLNTAKQTNDLTLYNNLFTRAERDKPFRESLLKGFGRGTSDADWAQLKADSANNRFTISRLGRQGGLQETSWFKAYLAGKPNDDEANRWVQSNMQVQGGINVLNRKIELAEKQVAAETGGTLGDQIKTSLTGLPSVPVNGTVVTPQDIQDALEGKAGKVTTQTRLTTPTFTGPGQSTAPVQATDLYVNGKVVQDQAVKNLYNTIKSKNESINDALSSKRIEVYNKLGFEREPWYFTNSKEGKNEPDLVTTLKRIFPRDKKDKEQDISIVQSDFAGGVKISVPGSKKGSPEAVNIIRKAGIGTTVEQTEDGVVTIRGTNYNVINQAVNNPILQQAAYQLQSIGETTAFGQTQPGAKVPDADVKIPVLIRGKMETITVETYKNNSRPQFKAYVEGDKDPRPIVAENAYELFEKLNQASIKVNKPMN